MRNFKLIAVCSLFLLIAACTQEQDLEPGFLQTMEKAELKNEERLSRTLTKISTSQPNSRSASADYGTLDFDKVYKRIASEDQAYANYMIRLYPPNGVDNSLEYLVMIGTDYGFRAYILQYQTTLEHINSINDPTNYTGYINILNLKRELLAQNYFIEGEDTEVPVNTNNRTTGTSCTCEYEYDVIVNQGDLSATLIITGIVCNCQQMGSPGGAAGGGGIGDPLPDPGYDSSYPDEGGGGGSAGEGDGEGSPDEGGSGGSGSGDDEPGGITKDPIGTVKTPLCGTGQVYTSSGSCVDEIKYWKNLIDNQSDPNEKRKLQLQYIYNHNAQEGKDFKLDIESLLGTPPGLSQVEKDAVNEVVNDYWNELVGRLIMANFYPVAEAAKPFVELALIDTGSGVLFQSLKGLLSVKWGVQLAKIGVNTTSLTNVVSRMKAGLSFAFKNSSLNLKIGGRNLLGIQGSKGVYNFTNVTKVEAKAIFDDMVAGHVITTVLNSEGKIIMELRWTEGGTTQFIKFRNFSTTNKGEMTIEVLINEYKHLRGGKPIELKFNL